MVQTPSRIEPRRQLERDRLRRAISGDSRHLLQRPNTAARATRELRQSFQNEPFVLVTQRHDIGDCSQRHKIQKRIQRQSAFSIPDLVGLNHFEGQRRRAQPGKWIPGAGAMRIHHGHSRRHGLVRLVMVRDDHIHAQLFRQRNFLVRGRSAVRRHEQRHSFVVKSLHGPQVESVSFPLAVRHIGPDIGADRTEERQVQARRSHPVYVVVAVETDRLPGLDRPVQSLDRNLHVGDQEGIMGKLMRHPGGGLVRRGDATGDEQRGGGG